MNFKSQNLVILLPIAFSFFCHAALAEDEILTQRFNVKIETNQSIFDKAIHEAGSTEGKAIIGAAATYLGVPPAVVGLATAGLSQRQAGNEHWRTITSPSGYTICYAAPVGTQYNGVESTEDSSFNATIYRPIGSNTVDGLAMYMAVPKKTGKRVRVMSTFDVTFVKKPPGWEKFSQCKPTGTGAWRSRNNRTALNVPCDVKALCP